MTKKEEEFIAAAEAIAEEIEKNMELAGADTAQSFIQRAREARTKLSELQMDGRDLVIGIVGCVKAGKSSFINALVFDGKEALPKAATPMTAALSRITYSEKPKATITFYSAADWANVTRQAEEYGKLVDAEVERRRQGQDSATSPASAQQEGVSVGKKPLGARIRGGISSLRPAPRVSREEVEAEYGPTLPENLRACRELVQMVDKSGIDVYQFLDQQVEIDLPEGGSYQSAIQDYVGADGKYTPIVNYIELGMNDSSMDGLCVVDTPGLNDPIVSRGRTTEKFLQDADIVFVVSSVGQFLVETDIQLLKEQLKQNNIHRASIIGSQLDSGILQYRKRGGQTATLVEALNNSIAQYKKHADASIKRLAETSSTALIQRLAQTEPAFVSAMLYSIGKKMKTGSSLSAEEEHIIRQLEKKFPDFVKIMEGPEDYFVLSHIPALREKSFEPIKQEKEEAIQERVTKFASNQSAELARMLEQVGASARSRRAELQTTSANKLEEKLRKLTDNLNSIRGQITAIFDEQAVRFTREVQDIKLEILRETGRHRDINISVVDEERSRERRTGLFGLFKKKEYWTEHINTGDTNDIINNITEYAIEAQRIINDRLGRIFDEKGLKQKIKQCVIGAFDLTSRDFNEQEILGPINRLLAGLSFRRVKSDYSAMAERAVDNEFPDGHAKGDAQVGRLKRLCVHLLNEVLEQLSDELDEASEDAEAQFNRQAAGFVDNIEHRVSDDLNKLKDQLQEKQQYIERYSQFTEDVDRYKAQMLAFGE